MRDIDHHRLIETMRHSVNHLLVCSTPTQSAEALLREYHRVMGGPAPRMGTTDMSATQALAGLQTGMTLLLVGAWRLSTEAFSHLLLQGDAQGIRLILEVHQPWSAPVRAWHRRRRVEFLLLPASPRKPVEVKKPVARTGMQLRARRRVLRVITMGSGIPTLVVDGKESELIKSYYPMYLFAYLILNSGIAFTCEHLSEALWPDDVDGKNRTRQAMHHLRRALDGIQAGLAAEMIDVEQFEGKKLYRFITPSEWSIELDLLEVQKLDSSLPMEQLWTLLESMNKFIPASEGPFGLEVNDDLAERVLAVVPYLMRAYAQEPRLAVRALLLGVRYQPFDILLKYLEEQLPVLSAPEAMSLQELLVLARMNDVADGLVQRHADALLKNFSVGSLRPISLSIGF